MVSTSQVPNSEILNRNSSCTCSFSNSSLTISNGCRLVAARKSRPISLLLKQRLALGLRQRIGKPLRQEDFRRDLLGLAIPVAEGLRVLLGEARDIGERLLQVAAEDQRRAVEMRLAELVARRDVFDAVGEIEILEPGRLADVEMIDRMQVVIEARRGRLFGDQRAAVLQPPIHQRMLRPHFCRYEPSTRPWWPAPTMMPS